MAEGPGGREVGRVSLRVLPDTSNFLPSLRRYVERVERTVAVRLGTTIDSTGLENDARRISERVERTVPNIRVPMQPVSDGFLRDAQAQITAASKALQVNIPLTADGERLRRSVLAEVAELEAQIRQMELEVPLDVESAARAKAELRERIASLQLLADTNAVTVPVVTAPAGGALGATSGPAIAALAVLVAALSGGIIASLPALIASIAAPVAVIALGFKGIAAAAAVAAPAFETMRQALSNTFAQDLAPVFATLAEILPQITPALQGIASALSGAFGAIIDQLATPEGLAALTSILTGIADAIIALTPALGPMTQLFLDLADTGMQAFVDLAPALTDALIQITALFSYLNDAGVIDAAVKGFGAFLVGATLVAGAMAAIAVALAAGFGYVLSFAEGVGRVVGNVINAFQRMAAPIGAAISAAVTVVASLPGRVLAAVSSLGGILFHSGATLIQGFINGILSMFGPLGQALGAIASLVASYFPGSPVKQGPLTAWNNGGSGKLLGQMLADGLEASKSVVSSASENLARSVAVPTAELVGAGVASSAGDSSGSAWRDPYLLADILTDSLRAAPPVVDTRDNARATARHRNARAVL